MKKYILTAWDDYDFCCGLNNIEASYDTLDECINHKFDYHYDNIVVYDRDTLEEVKVIRENILEEKSIKRTVLDHNSAMRVHIKTFLKEGVNYDLTDLKDEEYKDLCKYFDLNKSEKRFKTMIFKDKKVIFSHDKIENSLPYLEHLPL